MHTKLILSLSLCLLVASCSAQFGWPWQRQEGGVQGHRQQQQQQQQFSQCDIQRLTASEPSFRVRAEAGVIEIWDHQTPEFRCAGVGAARIVIQPGGLLQPSYTNTPYITFVEQGRGVLGVVVPGCPETFQSESESPRERGGRRFRPSRQEGRDDQHQKVSRIREGDVIAAPAGVVQWAHNDGDTELVTITLFDAKSIHNQLDENVRAFFLAGRNQQSGGGRHQRQREEEQGRRPQHQEEAGERYGANILGGIDDEILREVFGGADRETISKIQGENDDRGFIVRAQDLQVQVPEESEEEQEREDERRREQGRERETGRGGGRRGHSNGIEESFCNVKFQHNINKPAHADIYNPRAGRINTVNSNTLPILEYLRLSAEHIVLYKGAILGPKWNVNAHSVVYVTNGEGRVQVVGDQGNTVFDDVVQRGQILVVPQGFAVVKKAGREGLEWVELKTNDNAISSSIPGTTSVLRAIPAEVLATAYDIPREDALRLKNARREVGIFRPLESREEGERGPFAIV